MNLRQQSEIAESQSLSKYASLAASSLGRDTNDKLCDVRTIYQQDRDRILHSKSFRRLMHKTQVFLSPEGDHYQTRLTHTLEVNQIAGTVARALRLNEDLTSAIALGHDLGHTPFGHAGEEVLDNILPNGFKHNEQSVRVVEIIEKNGTGLNLTKETRNGIQCHSNGKEADTLEGQLVRYADKIGYMNHDIEDAVRAGMLTVDDIPAKVKAGLGETKSQRITTLVTSLIENSSDKVMLSPDIQVLYDLLRSFMFETVYLNPKAKAEENKAKKVVEQMYNYFLNNKDKMPEEFKNISNIYGNEIAISDYISCMTDRYCISLYEEIFVPRSWNISHVTDI